MVARIFFLLCAFNLALTVRAAPTTDEAFVTVASTQFRLHGKPYRFVGANLWYGAYLGSPGVTGDRSRLLRELDQLASMGITNIRVLGLSESSALKRSVRPAMTTAPGQFDEELLRGLDFFLAELAKHDMKAVIYLTNFWQWSGGMSQYAAWFADTPLIDPDVSGDWNGFMDTSATFYFITDAQQSFRKAIRTLIERRNTITGQRYSDDPTIMSWQLANEPRPGSDGNGKKNAAIFTSWINDTSQFIRALAPRHLVSTGNEGWMGTARDRELFIASHRSKHVDYLTFHIWGPNWNWFNSKNLAATYDAGWQKARDYLEWHVDAAQQLGKPIVLEEFGMNRDGASFAPASKTTIRDRYYETIFSFIEERATAGAPIAGSNFWAWNGVARAKHADFMWQPGDGFMGDPPQEAQGLYGVFDSDDSTIAVIRKHAQNMARMP